MQTNRTFGRFVTPIPHRKQPTRTETPTYRRLQAHKRKTRGTTQDGKLRWTTEKRRSRPTAKKMPKTTIQTDAIFLLFIASWRLSIDLNSHTRVHSMARFLLLRASQCTPQTISTTVTIIRAIIIYATSLTVEVSLAAQIIVQVSVQRTLANDELAAWDAPAAEAAPCQNA